MNKNLKICFILDHKLMNYRIPFFESFHERGCEITVFHNGEEIQKNYLFSQIPIKNIKLWKFEYRKLPSLKRFDIVVHMQNLRILNLWLLTLNPFRKYKVIHWGIGTSSSKGLSREKTLVSRIRNCLTFFSSAQILYSDFPLPLFSRQNQEKTFIGNNTIYNPSSSDFSSYKKDSLLFIGSLNERKGLNILIESFSSLIKSGSFNNIKHLFIVGDGPLRDNLINLTNSLGVSRYIHFTGNINDSVEKSFLFQRAFFCVSPLQAGLSVLESFSFGVPFITFKNAISGGEHLNVKNNENGFLVTSSQELYNVLYEIDKNPETARIFGENAFRFYQNHRKISNMVDAFMDAFNFVSK